MTAIISLVGMRIAPAYRTWNGRLGACRDADPCRVQSDDKPEGLRRVDQIAKATAFRALHERQGRCDPQSWDLKQHVFSQHSASRRSRRPVRASPSVWAVATPRPRSVARKRSKMPPSLLLPICRCRPVAEDGFGYRPEDAARPFGAPPRSASSVARSRTRRPIRFGRFMSWAVNPGWYCVTKVPWPWMAQISAAPVPPLQGDRHTLWLRTGS